MGSSNILPWDQPQTNMDNDATYAADAQRISGGIDGVEFPSATYNKFALQSSGIAYAVGQFLASKGFTISDSNLPNIVAALQTLFANVPGRGQLQQLSYSALQALNVGANLGFQLALAGNSTLTISGVNAGDTVLFIFTQDSGGGHTVVWPSNAVGMGQPDPSPNTVSVQLARASADLTLHASGPMVSVNGIVGTPIGETLAAAAKFTTPAAMDNSTNAATTAWVRALLPTSGNNGNGYWRKESDGFIRQWGRVTTDINNSTLAVSFPINFTNLASVVVVVTTYSGTDRITYVVNGSIALNGFTIANNGSGGFATWQAEGY